MDKYLMRSRVYTCRIRMSVVEKGEWRSTFRNRDVDSQWGKCIVLQNATNVTLDPCPILRLAAGVGSCGGSWLHLV